MLAVAPEGAEVDVEKPLAGGAGGPSAVYAARDASGKTIGYVAGGGAQGYAGVIKVILLDLVDLYKKSDFYEN